MFDEEPGRDAHDQCRFEIERLEAEVATWKEVDDYRVRSIKRLEHDLADSLARYEKLEEMFEIQEDQLSFFMVENIKYREEIAQYREGLK